MFKAYYRQRRFSGTCETCTYIAGNIETKRLQLISQSIFGNTMQFVQGKVGSLAAQRQTTAVHIENGIIQVPLGIGELAIDWPSSSDIGNVSSPLLRWC